MNQFANTYDLESIREAITPLDTMSQRKIYHERKAPRSLLARDINKRYRWDLLHASNVDVCALYDEGLNDVHIDAALRAIVSPLI